MPAVTEEAAPTIIARTQQVGGGELYSARYSSRSQVRVHRLELGNSKLCGGAGSSSLGDLGGAASAAPKPWESRSHVHVNGRSRVRKRTYIRAMRRLRRHGQARYKGKILHDTGTVVDSSATEPESGDGNDRSVFFTWNCSGLSPEVLAELLVWATDTRASFFVLQETHWGFTSDWSSDGWHFIHSAAKQPKTGGVLIALRADLLHKDSIRWSELVPGRLLQVRCMHGKQALDILVIYQQVKIRGDAAAVKANLERRDVVWRALEKVLRSLPCRSYVGLAGDFNTSLGRRAPLTGSSSVDTETLDAYKQESKSVGNMLISMGLVALNTFGRRSYTYIHPRSSSLIDYILVRRPAADARARRSCAVKSPMASWRTVGHRPVIASLRLDWRPWKWKAARETRATSSQISGRNLELSALGSRVPQVGFVAPKVERPTGLLRASWEAKRRYQDSATGTLRMVFVKMRLFAAFMKAQRAMRKAARSSKRNRLMRVLEDAEEAASKGDARALHRCVKFLSNPRSNARIRLRGDHGEIITGEEECYRLTEYAKQLFTGESVGSVPLERFDPELFSVDRWQRALLLLRSGKAVPQGEPAIASWKLDAQGASATLSKISVACLCCDAPAIPVEWSEIQLAWLAKPGKFPCVPRNLRSVGLMSADSKAFLLVLRGHVESRIRSSLYDVPQYSYRPGMDTHNAILRAVSHCKAVRALQKQAVQNHTARVMGAVLPELQGGLLVSLDMSKAFDSVPHKEIFLAMLEAGVEMNMARLILQVHVQTICRVRHAGHEGSCGKSRGLRQGCPIAPILLVRSGLSHPHVKAGATLAQLSP